MGDRFLVGVIVLQSVASLAYLLQGDWKQALVWGGIIVSNSAYLSLTRNV